MHIDDPKARATVRDERIAIGQGEVSHHPRKRDLPNDLELAGRRSTGHE
jgi:hypothetical protein